jgi:steroid delta-isomerase-like uncharacterized protein
MTMSAEANAAVVRRFFDEFVNGKNFAVIDELLAPDYVLHLSGVLVPLSREDHLKFGAELHAAFPDGRDEIADLIAAGDRVVTRIVSRGTHLGTYRGIPATGRKVTLMAVNIDRFVDGKIAERWLIADMLSVMQQLGVIPALD